MGALKYILVPILVFWLIRSILRGLFGRVVKQAQQRNFQQQQHQQQSQRRSGSGMNVDFNPRKSRKDKTSDEFKGGDYIDYEEVD